MPEGEGPSGPEELRARVAEIRAKEARGEELTTEEAGLLGAAASIASTNRERDEARKEGRLDEFREEHRVKSWMRGEETRPPRVGEAERRAAAEVREKVERGEPITTEEAGTLGGVERAENARERSESE